MKRLFFPLIVILSLLLSACNNAGTPTVAMPTAAATTVTTAPATPTPQPTGPPASLVDWINLVDAHPLPAEDWEAPQTNMLIYEGGEVRAQEASTARVDLSKNLIRVAPNTIFTYAQADADHTRLQLEEGQVWINVEGLTPGQSFEVETPGAVAAVRGTRFSVRVMPDGRTVISAREGAVSVIAGAKVVTLTAGSETRLPVGGEPSAPHPLSPEEQVRWGMASDAEINVIFPAFGEAQVVTQTGFLSNPALSPDGCYLGSFHYVPGSTSTEKDLHGPVYKNLCTGQDLIDTLPPGAEAPAFSPKGDRLAYTDYGGDRPQICTQALDGSAQACFGGDRYYGWPFWSPDGEWLAFYAADSDGGIQLYRARPDGSEMQVLTAGQSGNHHAQSWSPDGEWLAYIYDINYDQPGELWIVRADGSETRKLSDNASASSQTTWSLDGKYLAFAGFDKQIWLVTLEDDSLTPVTPPENHSCSQPAWTPTASGWPLSLFCKDTTQGRAGQWLLTEMGQPPQPLSDFSWGPVWSGDGKRVAFGRNWMAQDKKPYTEVYLLESAPGLLP
ncbi:MAG: FecR domain-containing protein [Anaerolineae bacterium]|jgi:hypothetical protein|nr:FecR domain-containing protein [Anaerolineae bacterium]